MLCFVGDYKLRINNKVSHKLIPSQLNKIQTFQKLGQWIIIHSEADLIIIEIKSKQPTSPLFSYSRGPLAPCNMCKRFTM